MPRKPIPYGHKIEVLFSERERALILEHTLIDSSTESLLNLAVVRGTKLAVRMTMGDLDELIGHIAATANHANTRTLRNQMDAIYIRLRDIEGKYEEEDDS